MSNPVARSGDLVIGTVESVSPSEIRVVLAVGAPESTALNSGAPTSFPRINGYLLVPTEGGALVGMISWIGLGRVPPIDATKRRDEGVIELPFPSRRVQLVPIGTLEWQPSESEPGYEQKLSRGVVTYPSVGDPVLLPSTEQLAAIAQQSGKTRRVQIGTSPLAANADVYVDPDRLFGRHLAVLGNTGSGKSCSIAGLIHWSVESAREARKRAGREGNVNARFIVLDPNGEYTRCFSETGSGARVFRIGKVDPPDRSIQLPGWMWDSREWAAFAGARPGAQRPVLMQALRNLRAGRILERDEAALVAIALRGHASAIDGLLADPEFVSNWRKQKDTARELENLAADCEYLLNKYQASLNAALGVDLGTATKVSRDTLAAHAGKNAQGNVYYTNFGYAEIDAVRNVLKQALEKCPRGLQVPTASEDAPIGFHVEDLPGQLEALGESADFGSVGQWIATLALRIRMMLADSKLGPVLNPSADVVFEKWLSEYIGANDAETGQVAVLDFSLVPGDVVHVVVAVAARVVFEAVQRYRRITGKELPTVLVLEEAHNFVRRSGSDKEDDAVPSASRMCRETFERIAREGRKFGLGLVISSQRPAELSPTVLAQCNTFLLHRIVNDRDQELVARLVPDNLGGLLRELPSLPTRKAILLGWVSAIPTMVEMRELEKARRPTSDDPRFWEVWEGSQERLINWEVVADDWRSSMAPPLNAPVGETGGEHPEEGQTANTGA